MSKLTTTIFIGSAALLLTACADQLQMARDADSSGSAFNQALHSGYLELAASERAEQDWRDSDRFAGKAIASAGGQAVGAESLAGWNLPEGSIGDLSAARVRLQSALDRGAANKAPTPAAAAQVSFDCWVQEQEEDIQPADIAVCRDGFETAMAQVDAALEEPKVAEPAPPPPPAEPAPLAGPFVVYFEFDSAELTADATRTVSQAADAVTAGDAAKIVLSGHADRVGSSDYNLALSARRVAAVTDLLMSRGVSPQQISSGEFGESRPAVSTPDNRREAGNRRVEISLAR